MGIIATAPAISACAKEGGEVGEGMPVYLPPLSRREFLRRAMVAAAALTACPKALAASRETDADSWALLSDLHLSADRSRTARGINLTEHFTKVREELLRLPKRPAGVFVTGDLAYSSGLAGDYEVVADLLKPLREEQVPLHLALGNHDNREVFWEAFESIHAAKRPLKDRQVALLPTRHANWFILDSLEKTSSTPGLLGREQLEWLASSLDQNPDQPALVLLHHNPGLNGNLGLKDTAGLLEVIRPRKQVKAYIYGHTHTWRVEQDPSGIHLINLPAVAYVFRNEEPAGWVHAKLRKDGLRLELRCIDASHARHGEIIDREWRA